jgi:hypothetical protein
LTKHALVLVARIEPIGNDSEIAVASKKSRVAEALVAGAGAHAHTVFTRIVRRGAIVHRFVAENACEAKVTGALELTAVLARVQARRSVLAQVRKVYFILLN